MNAPTNPIIRETALRAYPGWTVRQYKDGMLDARQTHGGGALTRGVETWAEVIAEVREIEGIERRERPAFATVPQDIGERIADLDARILDAQRLRYNAAEIGDAAGFGRLDRIVEALYAERDGLRRQAR